VRLERKQEREDRRHPKKEGGIQKRKEVSKKGRRRMGGKEGAHE
jgi:hypothetical protein